MTNQKLKAIHTNVTGLGNYMDCPARWEAEQRLPRRPPSLALFRGIWLDKALTLYYTEKLAGDTLADTKLNEFYRAGLTAEKEKLEKEELENWGTSMGVDLFDNIKMEQNLTVLGTKEIFNLSKIEPIEPQKNLKLMVADFVEQDVQHDITGRMDLHGIVNGISSIIEYKSPDKNMESKSYDFQISCYSCAFDEPKTTAYKIRFVANKTKFNGIYIDPFVITQKIKDFTYRLIQEHISLMARDVWVRRPNLSWLCGAKYCVNYFHCMPIEL